MRIVAVLLLLHDVDVAVRVMDIERRSASGDVDDGGCCCARVMDVVVTDDVYVALGS